jgi:hypothetical protein
VTAAGGPAPETVPTGVTTTVLPDTAGGGNAAPVTIAGAASGAASGAATSTAAAPVAAAGAATPAEVAPTLPFTGAPTGLLALTAITAIGLGVLMLQAGRMRFDVLFYQGRHVRPRTSRLPRLLA